LPAEKVLAADCPRPSKAKPLEERVAYLLEKAQGLAAERRYRRAEACLLKALALDPKSRDLNYYRARLKAWQGEHDQADAIAGSFSDDDPESQLFRSDLARYRAEDVERHRLHTRAALGVLYGVETQQRSMRAFDADASLIQERKSLSLGISDLERDFGAVTLNDKVYRLGLGFGIASEAESLFLAQETALSLAVAPEAKFAAKEALALRHTVIVEGSLAFYVEVGSKSYPDLFVRTLQVGGLLANGSFHYEARGYLTRGIQSDGAGGFFAGYDGSALHPELYVIGGRDAASRPFLTKTSSAAFLTLGAQVSLFLSDHWKLKAFIEDRTERAYRQKNLSLAVVWAD
jgi:hypothetical protein